MVWTGTDITADTSISSWHWLPPIRDETLVEKMTGGRDWDLLGPQSPWGGRDRESGGQGSWRGRDLPHGALVTLCTSVELSKSTRNEVMVTLKRLIYYCMYAKWKNTTDNQPVRSQELLKSRQLATISTNHRQNKCTELFLLLCAFGFFAKQKIRRGWLTLIASFGSKTTRFTEMSWNLVRDLPSDLSLLK